MKTLAQALKWIALISALFAFLICVMTVVTWIQVKRADPLNSAVITLLNDQLKSNPSDKHLAEEIRQLDLLARKAFFTSQWQIRTGGYLLAASLLIAIISLKWLEMIKPSIPEMPVSVVDNFWSRKKTARRWIVIAGSLVVLVTFFLVWLNYRELKVFYQDEKVANAGLKAENPQMVIADSAEKKADSGMKRSDSLPSASQVADGYPSESEIRNNCLNFRGYGGIGVSFCRNIPLTWDGNSGKNIRWKTEIPLPGYNSPVLWKDRVFLSGAKERKKEVYCLDAGTGKIVWTADLSKISGSPDQIPKVIAETGQAAPTMTTDGRRVYAIFANGDLAAVDMNGSIAWSKNLGLPKNHYGHASSLIMYRDLLIVQYDQTGSAKVMALFGKSGETAWETARNVKVSWSSPVLINTGKRDELILAAEPTVVSYNPATGKELWNLDCISGEVGPSVTYSNGMVFSVNDYSRLAAVKLGETPSLAWENDEYLSDVPSPVAYGNCVFVVTSYGAVACYDAATGEKRWVKELEKTVYASPMVACGKLYILDKTGVMHILNASATPEEAATANLGEGSCCTPVFGNECIIIRGNKSVYCIGK